MEESMTAEEAARLAEWLKAYGAKYADVVSCMNYLAKRKRADTGRRADRHQSDLRQFIPSGIHGARRNRSDLQALRRNHPHEAVRRMSKQTTTVRFPARRELDSDQPKRPAGRRRKLLPAR